MAERRRPPSVSVVATSPALHSDFVAGPLTKGARLSVTVVEALRDLIVVSLDHNSKVYQGALLDITNRSIKPFCTSPFPKTEDSAEDEAMFALKMRHTYVVSSRENEAPFNGGAAGREGTGKPIEPGRDKRAPRTKIDQHVRMRKLRPRQTLCSNCQSRCDDTSTGPTTTASRGSAKKNTAPLVSVVRGTRENPRVAAPLEAAAQGSGAGGELPQPPVPTQTSPSPWTEETHSQADVYASVAEDSLIKEELPSSAQMPESEEQQPQRQQEPPLPPDKYHEQDQMLVEQVPAQPVMNLRKRRSSSGTVASKVSDERRTTRADIRAQQQQQQQQQLTPQEHHHPTPQQSPVIKISFNNPQGKGTVVKIPAKVAVADYEETTSDDEEKEDFAAVPEASGLCAGVPGDGQGSAGGKGRRRKRDATATEATEGENTENQLAVETPIKHHKHKAGKHKRKRHKTSGGDSAADSDGESVPNFPQAAVGGDEAKDAEAEEEKEKLSVAGANEPLRNGDVVWGKVMGFPWWPGRILSLGAEYETSSANETDTGLQNGEAHVAWFGSSTSSRILTSSLAPFLRDFKLRYNRRKRGPYKEAIRQATQEAKAKSRTD